MIYFVMYISNLLVAVLILGGAWHNAVNETNDNRRYWLAFFVASCFVEVVILVFYLPRSAGGGSPDDMLTLIAAKVVLKPALLCLLVHDFHEQRRKIRRSEPFGQHAALLPQDEETHRHNQAAATMGKATEAASEVQKLNDSTIRDAGIREEGETS